MITIETSCTKCGHPKGSHSYSRMERRPVCHSCSAASATHAHRYKARVLDATSPAWEAIYDMAQRIGWPTKHSFDLEVDWRQVATEQFGPPATQFLWCIRPSGTHLIALVPRDLNDADPVSHIRAIEGSFSWEARHWFYWDGQALTEVTPYEAERLCQGGVLA